MAKGQSQWQYQKNDFFPLIKIKRNEIMVLFLDQILIHLPINQIHSYIIMKMETREQMNKKALSEKIPPLTPINLEIIKGRRCLGSK